MAKRNARVLAKEARWRKVVAGQQRNGQTVRRPKPTTSIGAKGGPTSADDPGPGSAHWLVLKMTATRSQKSAHWPVLKSRQGRARTWRPIADRAGHTARPSRDQCLARGRSADGINPARATRELTEP